MHVFMYVCVYVDVCVCVCVYIYTHTHNSICFITGYYDGCSTLPEVYLFHEGCY